jgi:hypothetical protein
MGSIIFIILRLSGLVDSRFDWVILCFLVSLDTIGLPALLGMLKKK